MEKQDIIQDIRAAFMALNAAIREANEENIRVSVIQAKIGSVVTVKIADEAAKG